MFLTLENVCQSKVCKIDIASIHFALLMQPITFIVINCKLANFFLINRTMKTFSDLLSHFIFSLTHDILSVDRV